MKPARAFNGRPRGDFRFMAGRRRRPAAAGWTAALLLAAGLTASAATIDSIGIDVRGRTPVDRDYVMTHTQARAGMGLDPRMVARDARALLETGRFAYVGTEAQPLDADRVRLVYRLEGKWKLADPVEIKGARRYRKARLREWSGLRAGDYFAEADAAAAAAGLREELRRRRHHSAEVEAEIAPDASSPGLARLRLTITEGNRTHLERVVFSGNRVFSDYELRRAMRLPSPWNPLNLIRKTRYRPDVLEAATDLVRERYRNAGYLDARVETPRSAETPRGRRVVVAVDEGPRYTLGTLDIAGVEVLDAAELLESIDLRSGETASMDRIIEASGRIRDAYSVLGYKHTAVLPDLIPRADDPAVVDLRFRVHEGILTDIRLVLIRGNRKTRDKVIRRELLTAPGDRYDGTRIRRGENRLRNLGFFSHVASYSEEIAPGLSDLVYEVEEQPTGQFMVGVGFSSIDKVIGFVEISQGNFDLFNWPGFTGGGQKLNLRAQFGAESRDYSVSFVEPWFLDRRLALSLDGYVRRRIYRDYDVERVGGGVGLGIPLRGPHRLDLGYVLERVDLLRVADTNLYTGADGQPFFFATEGRRGKRTFTAAVARDTRDSFMMPTRGHRIRLGAAYSGGILGGDTDIYGLDARAALHLPLWYGHVLSLHARAETVDAHGRDGDVALSDRLFAGGVRTVRGFRYRDVGPKAVRHPDEGPPIRRPQGGRSLAVGGAEYTVPLVDGIRLAGFVDTGNVWMDPYEFGGGLAVGAGIGLRFDLPGFPIRFDYAWPVRYDDPHTRSDRFSFWIGHGF